MTTDIGERYVVAGRSLGCIDRIRAHRRNDGCAGSLIDDDGRCHTCGKGIR